MRRIFLLLTLVLLGAVHAVKAQDETSHNFKVAKNMQVFNEIYSYLDMMYIDTLNADDVVGTAIKAMLRSLDPYTVYYPEEKVQELKTMYTGKYVGMGSLIRYNSKLKRVVVDEPYAGTPAAEAGLKKGDIILSVDDSVMTDKDVSYVSSHLRGDAGTTFVLKVHASDALATKSTILLDNARATTTTGDDNISNKLDEVTLLVKNTKFVPELILSINDIDVNVNKPVAVPVLLTNEPAYYGEDIDSLTALQFDVQVPEGASINTDDIVYGNRLQQSHIVAVTKMEGNTYRFMVSSSSLGKIRGNNGELFAFYMTTTNTVPEESVLKVTNQVFSTVHGQRYVSDNADLAPDFDVKVTNHRNIYDLNNDGVVNAMDVQIIHNA